MLVGTYIHIHNCCNPCTDTYTSEFRYIPYIAVHIATCSKSTYSHSATQQSLSSQLCSGEHPLEAILMLATPGPIFKGL